MERGPGYLPGDILLVGNAGFRGSRSSKKEKKKKKFPKGGHSKWNHRSIGDREADLSIMRHRLSNQRKASSVRNERNLSLSLRLRNGREAGGCGTTTIGISDSWPMGRVFIWIAISPGSALLSLYDRFIDRLLPSTAKTKSKFLSLFLLTN